MIAKIVDLFSLIGTFAVTKILPMVILAALGVLAIQMVLKLVRKVREK